MAENSNVPWLIETPALILAQPILSQKTLGIDRRRSYRPCVVRSCSEARADRRVPVPHNHGIRDLRPGRKSTSAKQAIIRAYVE
jgi:hypothetical protein